MRARTAVLVTALTISASGVGAVGSDAATPPVGTCPPAFDGPLTFEQVVAKYPPPPGVPDPIGALSRFDKNRDGSVCVLDIPGDPINLIDNIARVPSQFARAGCGAPIDAGASLAEAAALARHANARVTAQVYAGLTEGGREKAAVKLVEA